MTWHLKDRELEQKLMGIDCDFVETLTDVVNDRISEIDLNNPDEKEVITVGFFRNHLDELGELYFFLSDLEEVPEYNSNDWNEYPKVEPPRNIPMRLEIFRNDYQSQHTHRYAAVFLAGNWWNENDMIEIKENDEIRFRPWED